MILKSPVLYFASGGVFLFYFFLSLLKKRRSLGRYCVLLILWAVATFFIGQLLFPFDLDALGDGIYAHEGELLFPFKLFEFSKGSELLSLIAMSAVFCAAVSVLYGFFSPALLKAPTYFRTVILSLGIIYAVQILAMLAFCLGAVGKIFDTSVFVFEFAGVTVGYFAWAFVADTKVYKKITG